MGRLALVWVLSFDALIGFTVSSIADRVEFRRESIYRDPLLPTCANWAADDETAVPSTNDTARLAGNRSFGTALGAIPA